MKYVCSKCNKFFDNYEGCKSHEFSCGEKYNETIYIKYIVVDYDVDEHDIYIYEHPNAAQKTVDYYVLSTKSRHYDDVIKEEKFDEIVKNYDNDTFYIVTKNSDESYEKDCINKLINHKKQIMIDYYNKMQEKINNIGKHYKVTRKVI